MRYDWELIRDQYVTGADEITLENLAAGEGSPSINTLKKRSAAEGWTDLRAQYRHQACTKTWETASTDEAEVRARHIRIARDMQEKALAALEKLEPEELSSTELRQYLVTACDIERKAMGILEPFDADLNRLDFEKLTDEELREIVRGGKPRQRVA